MSESGDSYVVHVSLPDRDLSKVDARVENGRTLMITASEEKKVNPQSAPNSNDKNAAPSSYLLGRYEQALTLPGDVDASKMHVDRSGTQLTITIPKAEHPATPSTQQ
jgi:HSP20 family molecular chaperone IbpA